MITERLSVRVHQKHIGLVEFTFFLSFYAAIITIQMSRFFTAVSVQPIVLDQFQMQDDFDYVCQKNDGFVYIALLFLNDLNDLHRVRVRFS